MATNRSSFLGNMTDELQRITETVNRDLAEHSERLANAHRSLGAGESRLVASGARLADLERRLAARQAALVKRPSPT